MDREQIIKVFLRAYLDLKIGNTWSGADIHQDFRKWVLATPLSNKFNNNGNYQGKSSVKKVCDDIFSYKDYKKRYKIKTIKHLQETMDKLNH
jgi:hypothetical protein